MILVLGCSSVFMMFQAFQYSHSTNDFDLNSASIESLVDGFREPRSSSNSGALRKLDDSFLEMVLMMQQSSSSTSNGDNDNLRQERFQREGAYSGSDNLNFNGDGEPDVTTRADEHNIAGLSCQAYYPSLSKEAVQDMVYWRDIPSDAAYKSPFYDENKYLTFQPDDGGWNNIRMGMETVVLMAHAMGRTLVLPPRKRMYLLGDSKNGKQREKFDFNDFFHMDSLSKEHDGINIVTMEEFLEREGMTGRLKNTKTNITQYPPHKRTDWNGHHLKELWDYLGDVGVQPNWSPGKCLAAFPASKDTKDEDYLENIMNKTAASTPKDPHYALPNHYFDKPVHVDAEPIERLKENLARRRELCIYNEELQDAPHIFFTNGYPTASSRLLVHYYAFLFFQDWKQGLWALRFVRDHIRYVDELMCAAATIVNALRQEARRSGQGKNPQGIFNTMHIRRGDFQYKNTRIDADGIYNNIKDVFHNESTIYIATGEFRDISDSFYFMHTNIKSMQFCR